MTAAVQSQSERALWGEPLRRLLGVSLGLFAIAIVIVVPTALRVKGISLFDESTHADYAYEVAHGHIPARGSPLSDEIRAEIACRGPASRKVDQPLQNCGKPLTPITQLNGLNQNYNWGHPPLYYAVTGVLARAGGVVWSGHHFITLARLTGVLWLFAAMVVLYVALRKFRVRWDLAACGAALMAFAPAIFYLDATVTNDAAAALCGALGLLVVARIFVDGKLGIVLPLVLAGAAAATKILNALPFLIIALILLIYAIRERGGNAERARRLAFIAVAMVVAVGVVYVGWNAFQHSRGLAHWQNPIAGISSQPIHGEPFDELFSTSFTGTNLLSYGYLPPQLSNAWMGALLLLWGPLAAASSVVVIAVNRAFTVRWTVAATAILGALTYPLAVEIEEWHASNDYFPHVVMRYGVTFVPVFLACMAIATDDKRLERWLYGFTAAAAGVALYTVFGPLTY